MLDLVRKRHEGDGWQVFSELANGTGWKVKGWADAAALGIWPSRGHEFHGYEFKISREDLKKELRDPSKADNVGKYCDFWWLVVSDEKLLEGLVIPETWGILVPRGKVLRTVRKAPKLDAKPFDRAFCAAMIRNVTKTWVPKHVHDRFREDARKKAREELELERKLDDHEAARELRDLRAMVGEFERASGVKLSPRWEVGSIAKAVAAVLEARTSSGNRFRGDHEEPAALVRAELARVQRSIAGHEQAIAGLRAAAGRVELLLERMQESEREVPA